MSLEGSTHSDMSLAKPAANSSSSLYQNYTKDSGHRDPPNAIDNNMSSTTAATTRSSSSSTTIKSCKDDAHALARTDSVVGTFTTISKEDASVPTPISLTPFSLSSKSGDQPSTIARIAVALENFGILDIGSNPYESSIDKMYDEDEGNSFNELNDHSFLTKMCPSWLGKVRENLSNIWASTSSKLRSMRLCPLIDWSDSEQGSDNLLAEEAQSSNFELSVECTRQCNPIWSSMNYNTMAPIVHSLFNGKNSTNLSEIELIKLSKHNQESGNATSKPQPQAPGENKWTKQQSSDSISEYSLISDEEYDHIWSDHNNNNNNNNNKFSYQQEDSDEFQSYYTADGIAAEETNGIPDTNNYSATIYDIDEGKHLTLKEDDGGQVDHMSDCIAVTRVNDAEYEWLFVK